MADQRLEHWRPVVGFEGRYEVSDLGRVASLPTRTWPTRRLLAVVKAKRGGYPTVVLRKDNKQYARPVHRLVCEAWHGPQPFLGAVVRHLDGDCTHNTPANLSWGTSSENNLDTVSHGRHNNASKTHCIHGHPLFGPNLYVNPASNARQCRTCQAAYRAAYVEAKGA